MKVEPKQQWDPPEKDAENRDRWTLGEPWRTEP
jgi:hypothetical protein